MEVARQLAAEGWRAIGVGRNIERLRELAEQTDGAVAPCQADLASPDAPEKIVAAARDGLGGLDLLVNNAGCSWVGEVADMPTEKLDAILNVNVRALMLLCRDAIPMLEASGQGQIVNIASVAAHLNAETIAVYSASKAAAITFSRALAKELAPRNIRVNVLSPTGTDTDLFSRVGVDMDRSRLVPVADMARLVVLLTQLPVGVDIGEIIAEKRFVPGQ